MSIFLQYTVTQCALWVFSMHVKTNQPISSARVSTGRVSTNSGKGKESQKRQNSRRCPLERRKRAAKRAWRSTAGCLVPRRCTGSQSSLELASDTDAARLEGGGCASPNQRESARVNSSFPAARGAGERLSLATAGPAGSCRPVSSPESLRRSSSCRTPRWRWAAGRRPST